MAWVNQIFAIIYKEKIVKIESYYDFEIANEIAVTIYGQDAIVVDVTQYPVEVGDLYQNGHFFRPNESGGIDFIYRQPTEKEYASQIRSENADLVDATITSQVRLVELENDLVEDETVEVEE